MNVKLNTITIKQLYKNDKKPKRSSHQLANLINMIFVIICYTFSSLSMVDLKFRNIIFSGSSPSPSQFLIPLSSSVLSSSITFAVPICCFLLSKRLYHQVNIFPLMSLKN